MTLAAYPRSGRLGEEWEQWVRNARALSALRVARTRTRGAAPSRTRLFGRVTHCDRAAVWVTLRCQRASGGRPTATALRAPHSSPAPPGTLPHQPPSARPVTVLALFPSSACVCDAAEQQQQHPKTFSLLSRRVCRWSHGNVSKEWQSTLSAVEGRHAKRL